MPKTSHVLEVDTQKGILKLDGISLYESATECHIHYYGGKEASVTLSLVAEVKLNDLLQVKDRRANDA